MLVLIYDILLELIEKFVEGLKVIVVCYLFICKDYYEIYLNGMGVYFLDILFYIFFEVFSWLEELKGRYEILFEVFKLVKVFGVWFVFFI